MDENVVLQNEVKKKPIWAIVFLVLVLFLTWILFWVNLYLKSWNEKISTEVSSIEQNISSIKKSKNIQIYELLNDYKTNIKKMEVNNNVLDYIKHLTKTEQKYWINFSGFSLSSWEIKTQVLARKIWIRTNSTYEKVSKFINDYRVDKDSIFDLEFINSFDWMDEIKFDVKFKVKTKNNLKSNIKENE